MKHRYEEMAREYVNKHPDSIEIPYQNEDIMQAFLAGCDHVEKLDEEKINKLERQLEQQRFNNKHNLSIDQKVADRMATLEQELLTAQNRIKELEDRLNYESMHLSAAVDHIKELETKLYYSEENSIIRKNDNVRLFSENVDLKQVILEMIEALEFYASWRNWIWSRHPILEAYCAEIRDDYNTVTYQEEDGDWFDCNFGGKRARQVTTKHQNLIEELRGKNEKGN